MKSNNIIRRIVVFLLCMAITLSYMPASFYAYAQDGEEAAEPEKQVEQIVEEKKEEVKEEPKAEENLEAAEMQKIVKEEASAVVEAEAVKSEVEAEIIAEEAAAEQEPVKPAVTLAKTIYVTYHFYQKNADGEYVEARSIKKSVTSGNSTAKIALSTANTYVKNTKLSGEGNMVTEFTKTWSDANGNAPAFPLTMSYEEAGSITEDGKNVDVKLYADYATHPASVNLTIRYSGIMSSEGEVVDKESVSSLGWGSGSTIKLKKLESNTGVVKGNSMYADFTYNGKRYVYTGEWEATDSNGNSFTVDSTTSISIKAAAGGSEGTNYKLEKDLTLTFSPIYEITDLPGLDLNYIDNVSTGSGSWSNKDENGIRSAFTSLTHELRDPSIKSPGLSKHYRFLYWEDDDTEVQYAAGEKMTITAGEGIKKVSLHAWWQPSVTVQYNVNDSAFAAEEFEDINIYSAAADAIGSGYAADGDKLVINGEEYLGWYDAAGNKLSADEIASLPGITSDRVDQKIVEVYAKKAITVKAASKSWVYDGKEHSDDEVSIAAGNLLGNDEIVAKSSSAITDAGSMANVISEIRIMRNGKDVTSKYEITKEAGELTVTKAPLQISTETGSKVYDGTALTAGGEIRGFVNGEEAGFKVTGTQTEVGSSSNTYELKFDGSAKEANYEIVKEEIGTLTVTAAPAVKGGGTTATPAAPADPAAPATDIADNAAPAAAPAANIPDSATPLAQGTWALLNLIAAVMTALGAMIAIFRRKEEDENAEAEDDDNRGRRMFAAKAAGILTALAAMITFILTEDMSLQMVLADGYTLLMAAMLAVQAVSAAFCKKASEADDEEDADANTEIAMN